MLQKTRFLMRILGLILVGISMQAMAKSDAAPQKSIPITLQLQWTPQAQFAGFFVAKDKGFYKEEGLDVKIQPGGADIAPHKILAQGKADFAISWLPKVLTDPETQKTLVNIAQVFQRSATSEIVWKDSGITQLRDLRGKKVGTWGLGEEFELYAALEAEKIYPYKGDITIVKQSEGVAQFINREIDAMEAMLYNEYFQILEQINPKTGKPYQPSDLLVFDFDDPSIDTGMLQDGIYVRRDWIAIPGNELIAEKFLRASFKGWIYCRDHYEECKSIVLKYSSSHDKPLEKWQLDKIHDLVWPSPQGIGIMDKEDFLRTVNILLKYQLIDKHPAKDFYRTDLAEKAGKGLS